MVLIVGSNTAESHPVLATRVKRAHKLHGEKLIVFDLRENEMARRADLHLRVTPSTDIVWLSAVARYILDEGLAHSDFLRQWVNGLPEYRQSLEPFTLEFASKTCNLPVETLKRVAHMIAEAKSVYVLWAMGVTQHSNGSDTSTAISNLLLVTGNYMRPGTGAYPLRGHNKVQGASDHGAMPNLVPDYKLFHPEPAGKSGKADDEDSDLKRGRDFSNSPAVSMRQRNAEDAPRVHGAKGNLHQHARGGDEPSVLCSHNRSLYLPVGA